MRLIICENGAAMDTMPLLQTPPATAFDAASALLSAAIYGVVALAALLQSPRDVRVRVFAAVAAAAIAPYGVTALIWKRGAQAAWSRPVVIVVGLSLMIGSLALFHFSQVCPWRRPWIRRHGVWLWCGYAAVLVVAAAAFQFTPSFDLDDYGASFYSDQALLLVLLAIGVPALFVLGMLVPFAGLLSLYKSWVAARIRAVGPARVTAFWMLISQMGGGLLTILIIPLLRLVAPAGPWVTIAAALLFACGLLMPLAFGMGIWKLGLLDLPIDALPQ